MTRDSTIAAFVTACLSQHVVSIPFGVGLSVGETTESGECFFHSISMPLDTSDNFVDIRTLVYQNMMKSSDAYYGAVQAVANVKASVNRPNSTDDEVQSMFDMYIGQNDWLKKVTNLKTANNKQRIKDVEITPNTFMCGIAAALKDAGTYASEMEVKLMRDFLRTAGIGLIILELEQDGEWDEERLHEIQFRTNNTGCDYDGVNRFIIIVHIHNKVVVKTERGKKRRVVDQIMAHYQPVINDAMRGVFSRDGSIDHGIDVLHRASTSSVVWFN